MVALVVRSRVGLGAGFDDGGVERWRGRPVAVVHGRPAHALTPAYARAAMATSASPALAGKGVMLLA